MSKIMTNDEKLQEFIVKATGKTIGRCSKVQLATLFANTYAEYVKAYKQGNEQIEQGYKLYKEKDDKIIEITEAIKDLDTIPTSVITTFIEAKSKEKVD